MDIFRYYLAKLKGNPLSLLGRAFSKTVIEPLKYKTGEGYKSSEYWQDRFAKHGESILGPGDETEDEVGNREMYEKAKGIFIQVCQKEIPHLPSAKVLEIGCGGGFYTQIFHDLKVAHYTAVDITDIMFARLKTKFPTYRFLKKDVSTESLEGQFDLIVMIDVVEHIVEKNKFDFAMKGIKNALAPGGVLLITPVGKKRHRHLYYVNFWSLEDISAHFQECTLRKLVPYRYSELLTIKREKPP